MCFTPKVTVPKVTPPSTAPEAIPLLPTVQGVVYGGQSDNTPSTNAAQTEKSDTLKAQESTASAEKAPTTGANTETSVTTTETAPTAIQKQRQLKRTSTFGG